MNAGTNPETRRGWPSTWERRVSAIDYPWSDKRVLVCGGTGFIGRRLVAHLARLGPRELSVLSGPASREVALPLCKRIRVDLGDRNAVREALAGQQLDLVINATGRIDHSAGSEVYPRCLAANLATTVNLVEALQQAQVERFVHLGSNAEYGHAPCVHRPDTREEPGSAYGVAKLAATHFVLAKAASEGFPACVVRPFLVYGPGQGENSFLQQLLRAAVAGGDLLTTAGEQTRDFVSVDRVAHHVLLTAQLVAPGTISNACTGVEITLREVIEHMGGFCPDLRPRPGALPYRRGELMRSVGQPLQEVSAAEAREELFSFLETEVELLRHQRAAAA